MNEITILITLLLALMLLVTPRKHFILPFVLGACFVPVDQRIIISGLDFTPVRILILGGFVRILLRHEWRQIKWNTFDKMLLVWAMCGAIVYVLQWRDIRALIYKCGALYDILGLYILFRHSMPSWQEVRYTIKIFALCLLIMTPFIVLELLTGRNPFAMIGMVYTSVREGRFRCAGPFPISILMGSFWAILFPLFFSMAIADKNKILYWSAVIASIFAVIASASSTPLGTLLIVVLIIGGFKWRRYTSVAWKTFFLLLIVLHFSMKAPVWHLLSRVNLVGGSTGWHRYYIIEQAVNHFDEWAWLGTRDTSGWEYRFDTPRQFDITNQFVLEGVTGGAISLVFFVAVIVIGFRALAKYYQQSHERENLWISWGVFVVLLGHCITFLGVSYFGQIYLLWYLTLGIIGFIVGENKKNDQHFSNLSRRNSLYICNTH